MKKNMKGFTLIELLAVIVILGILLAIAIPAVTNYINESKKKTYISNVQTYARTAMQQASIGNFAYPVNTKEATLIKFDAITPYLEQGGLTSPYGKAFNQSSSFVLIVNVGTAENPKYKSFIAAIDEDGYGVGTLSNKNATAQAILYDELKMENIIQISSGGVTLPSNNIVTITSSVCTEENHSCSYTIKNKYPSA